MKRDEAGTVTVFVTVFMLALLVVAGLVIDGGRMLAARREVANVAESAARAGAQELDTRAARTSATVQLDPVAAQRRATEFLAASGYSGTVTVEANRVHVQVSATPHLFILGIAGMSDATVTANGEARGVRAVREEGN